MCFVWGTLREEEVAVRERKGAEVGTGREGGREEGGEKDGRE